MKKVLLFGARGFVGRHIGMELERYPNINLVRVGHSNAKETDELVNLEKLEEVTGILIKHKPDCVINAAGIIENSDSALSNITFTGNIITAINRLGLLARLVICGSAAEYGYVDRLPVKEDDQKNPFSDYGKAKYEESRLALSAFKEGMDIVIARIFNPIGLDMPSKFLVNSILNQLDSGSDNVTISRLDALRDYIDIADVARAIVILALSDSHNYPVYNIGSGKGTTNGTLANKIISEYVSKMHLRRRVDITEVSEKQEQQIASIADISRIRNEFDWHPEKPVLKIIEDIIHAKATR